MQHKSKETEKEISELTSIISNLEYDRARTASIDRSEFKVHLYMIVTVHVPSYLYDVILLLLCRLGSYKKH